MAHNNDGESTHRRVERVSGVSSYVWTRVTIVLLLIWIANGIAIIPVILTRPAHPGAGWFALGLTVIWAWVAELLPLAVTGTANRVQSARELRRGYTDAVSAYINAAQIDPRTGVVIREPGQPFLTKEQLVDATRHARTWASGVTS